MIDIPFYYINMENAIIKRDLMEKDLSKNVTTFYRVSAIDGKKVVPKQERSIDGIKYYLGKPMNNKAKGCLLSHFKAIKMFENSEYKHAIICEDDLSFALYNKLNIDIKKVIKYAPKKWNIIKLYTSSIGILDHCFRNIDKGFINNTVFQKKFKNRYANQSTLIYIINRSALKKINENFYKDNRLVIDESNCTIDGILWLHLNTFNYCLPLFISNPDIEKNGCGIKSNNRILKFISKRYGIKVF